MSVSVPDTIFVALLIETISPEIVVVPRLAHSFLTRDSRLPVRLTLVMVSKVSEIEAILPEMVLPLTWPSGLKATLRSEPEVRVPPPVVSFI